MTPAKWDRHKRTFCQSCEFGLRRGRRRCPIIAILDKNPNDRQCQSVFTEGKDGHCSQFKLNEKGQK